jgi:ADP-ribose pyrophosphatase YjhB (NUDIX family)
MAPIPEFVRDLRRHVGRGHLWLPGITAVVRRGDEVLLVRRSDNGEWAPIGGIVEPREEAAACAVREVREETGVEVTVDRLASTSVMRDVRHPNGDVASYLDLTFACTWRAGEARVADDESTDVGWFGTGALPPMRDVLRERIAAAVSAEAAARFSV